MQIEDTYVLSNSIQKQQNATSITLSPKSKEIVRYVKQSLTEIDNKGSEYIDQQNKYMLQVCENRKFYYQEELNNKLFCRYVRLHQLKQRTQNYDEHKN